MTLDDIWKEDLQSDVENINDHIFASIIKSSVEMQKEMISEYKNILKNLFSGINIQIIIPLFTDLPHEKIMNLQFLTTISFKDMKFEKEICFMKGLSGLERDVELNIFKESVLLNAALGEISSSPALKKRI